MTKIKIDFISNNFRFDKNMLNDRCVMMQDVMTPKMKEQTNLINWVFLGGYNRQH
jgi:hypothetical protein